ncbi:hypothetical protein CDV55_102414 [Aspergillus turcosus]|nr:hypothetical protein CDV55_102414 [Aspergillus turcosus]
MSYLPPGWTESQLRAATVNDLRRIPEDKLHELDVDVIENINAQTIVRIAQRYAAQRLDRERMGLPPAPRKPIFKDAPKADPVVQVVERAGLDDFGFLILRTDYSSEERWEKWQEGYHQIIEATWAEVSGGEKVKDRFLTPLVDNEVLNDAGLAQIAE